MQCDLAPSRKAPCSPHDMPYCFEFYLSNECRTLCNNLKNSHVHTCVSPKCRHMAGYAKVLSIPRFERKVARFMLRNSHSDHTFPKKLPQHALIRTDDSPARGLRNARDIKLSQSSHRIPMRQYRRLRLKHVSHLLCHETRIHNRLIHKLIHP